MSRRGQSDVLVVGGGPAGLAAANAAADAGARVTLVERDERLGGILNQCVHDGFGLELFGESLTGPEYAARQVRALEDRDVEILLDSHVLGVTSPGAGPRVGPDATATPIDTIACEVLSPHGHELLPVGAVVLAMGCRERSFGSLAIAGGRPSGVFTAGTAQRLVNVDGLTVGRRAVILGSGDVGLIMARRLVLEGAEVACVVERLPYAGGLPRNVMQCLLDFDIPLLLVHTVVEVLGDRRLEGAVIARVGADGAPLPDTERIIDCDTLLVSVGLIPENELTRGLGADMDPLAGGAVVDDRRMTSRPGVFACGNVLHVHDLADRASLEGCDAGRWAAGWAASPWPRPREIKVSPDETIRYAVPQRLGAGMPARLDFRVVQPRGAGVVRAMREGREVTVKTFPYLAPSELATIDIPALDPGPGGLVLSVADA